MLGFANGKEIKHRQCHVLDQCPHVRVQVGSVGVYGDRTGPGGFMLKLVAFRQ